MPYMHRGMEGNSVIRAERRARALSMRRDGYDLQAIGDELGITRQGAHDIIKRALDNMLEIN